MQAAKFVLQLIKTSCKEGVTSSRRSGDVYKSICYVEASLITFLLLSSSDDPGKSILNQLLNFKSIIVIVVVIVAIWMSNDRVSSWKDKGVFWFFIFLKNISIVL